MDPHDPAPAPASLSDRSAPRRGLRYRALRRSPGTTVRDDHRADIATVALWGARHAEARCSCGWVSLEAHPLADPADPAPSLARARRDWDAHAPDAAAARDAATWDRCTYDWRRLDMLMSRLTDQAAAAVSFEAFDALAAEVLHLVALAAGRRRYLRAARWARAARKVLDDAEERLTLDLAPDSWGWDHAAVRRAARAQDAR